jgi:hypothetical protein
LADNYNSGSGTSPDREQYPTVADPDGPDLNQLYAEYIVSDLWRARFGRQRITLDNQRFIGGVGWRQNEQTYDGISVVAKPREGAELTYAWVNQVNRIFGTTSPDGRHSGNIHLLNARFGSAGGFSLVPYAYYIDNDDAPAFSTLSVGLRLSGGWKPGGLDFGWVAEYAYQEDAANGPVDYDASYYHLALDWKISKGLLAGIGFESLGGYDSQEGSAFRTPLATLYGFQGWTDKFLTTPDAGVEDLWLKLVTPLAGWKLAVIYHDFSAESGGADFGSEIDISAGYALSKRYGIELRGAVFDSDNADFDDTTKLWFTFTAAF